MENLQPASPDSSSRLDSSLAPGPRAQGTMLDWWEARSVSFKRGVGLFFDLFCIFCLSFVPFLYHAGSNWSKFSGFNGKGFPPEFGAALLLVGLLNSPLPLMSLRFFCKFVIHSQTPGEMLCGFTPKSQHSGFAALCNHMGYALLLWLSTTVASTFAAIFISLVLMPIMPVVGEHTAATPFMVVLGIGIYFWSYVAIQARFFKPKFADRLESNMDIWCRMQVVPRVGTATGTGAAPALQPVTLQVELERMGGSVDASGDESASDER